MCLDDRIRSIRRKSACTDAMDDQKPKYSVGLGVTGGIAAYKAIEVLRLLQKNGCLVRVAMTKNASEFVQPLTFRALTDEYVLVDDYDPGNPDPIAHVNFSQSIDLLLIVPATANILAKFANGVADDFLTSTYLASTATVLVAPAMNTSMWDHPATQRNIGMLEADGVIFVEPVSGELACKTVGTGKLEDVENIVTQAMSILDRGSVRDSEKDLTGESLLLTVGGTREAIDPVRFISNRSSGKMGFALAEAAVERGAEVTVVAGSTTADEPRGIRTVKAPTASQMYDAVMAELPKTTVFIGAAAVSDYRPKHQAESKIKKNDLDNLVLELERTRDILAEVSKLRKNGQIVAGFAAETTNVIAYAKEKLDKKGLDLVVANDITKEGAGFDTDTNIATILVKDREEATELPLMSKRELANRILDVIVEIRNGR